MYTVGTRQNISERPRSAIIDIAAAYGLTSANDLLNKRLLARVEEELAHRSTAWPWYLNLRAAASIRSALPRRVGLETVYSCYTIIGRLTVWHNTDVEKMRE
jgi:hypothetical protein